MQRLSHISVLVTLLAASAIGQCNTVTTSSPGNNGQNGTMFNIVNTSGQAVKVTRFEQAFFSGASDNMFIYTVAGGWSGNENNAAAWTLVGSALAVPHGLTPQLDPLPIQLSVVIGAGATQGFYITGDAAATVAYTTGAGQLNTVIGSDGTIDVTCGPGKAYPFAGNFGLPTAGRLWIGRVLYEKTVATAINANNVQNGTIFDIVNTSGNPIVVWHFDQVFFQGASDNMEIYTRPGSFNGFETSPASWNLVGSAAAVPHGVAPQLDPIPIPVNLIIPPGATRAFCITGTAPASGVGYTTGIGQLNTIIGSDGTLDIRCGVGSQYPFAVAFGLPTAGRLWNGRVHYGNCTIADNTPLGQGCVREVASVYENFNPPAGFDLNGSGMSFVPAGTAYAVLPGLTAFIAPTGAAVNVAVGDDVQQNVPIASAFSYPGGSTNSLIVCSNGYVSVALGNGTSFVPNVAAMLAFPQTAWGNWHDFYPTGGANGNVKFEEVGPRSIFTWDAVIDFGSANLNTWQIQFDRASGTVTIVWVTMSNAGNEHLVFHSPGGPNLDPGNTDLSVALAGGLSLGAVDRLPLALAAGSRPLIGTNWNLQVQDIPPTGVLGVEVFGLSDPGINDLFFIGMPTCGLRASLDVLNAFLVGAPTHNYILPIPLNPVLVGIHVYTTSAVFQVPPINAFGAITSNGIDGRIGNF